MKQGNKVDFSRRRFHISPHDHENPVPNQAKINVAGLTIAHDPEFACVHFADRAGQQVGVAIGYPYFPGHGYPAHGSEIRLNEELQGLEDIEDAVLPGLSGPCILILHGRSNPTLYLSPGGEMPIVYDAEAKRAASTTDSLLDDRQYEERFDQILHDKSFGRNATEGWIIGDRTAHKGVRRLLPNHALDLVTWQARRHWPRRAEDISWLSGDDVIAEITRDIGAFCTASASRFDMFVALTAGVDTRLVLSACRQVKDKIDLYTIFVPSSPIADLDTTVAKRIADGLNIRHQQLENIVGSPEEAEAWNRAVGHCTRHPNSRSFHTLDQFPPDAAIASGLFGEVGCGWPYEQEPLTINERQIDARQIVLRLKCPDDPQIVETVDRWLEPVRDYPPSVILDLAYWELRMGGWSCGQRPAQGALRTHLSPLAQRRVLQQFVRLRPEEKADDAFVIRCMTLMWPEVRQWEFNKFGNYRDWLIPIRKLMTPGRLQQFMRTIRAGLLARRK